MFATITPVLALGATAERGRIFPALLFTFIWSTLVYDVGKTFFLSYVTSLSILKYWSTVACWTWNPSGWAYTLGSLDFA